MKAGRLFALALLCLSTQIYAQSDPDDPPNTDRVPMTYHGISPPLSELARNQVPVAPGMGQFQEDHVERIYEEPVPPSRGPQLQPFVQTQTPTPFAAVAGVSFEGPGTGLAGFSMTGAPPDNTLAVGPNHVIAWVNSQYAIFSKTGTLQIGPVNGNALFTGLGNVCETTNRGDPILQYDRMADRWILSQFAFAVSGGAPVAPYLQCIAVSTSNNPAGTYVRYSVAFSSTSPSGFNDYGKLGVWPDGYYIAYNIFGGSPAGGNTGVALCVSDRVKMLAGDPTATTLCAPIAFYGGGSSFLPADLDGTTLPSDTSQGGLFMRVSNVPALRYLKLKANFTAGTVTLTDGFGGASGSVVNLPLPATTYACNGSGGTCVAQPGTATQLDTLGSRLMYRLAFRNRGGVESMMVTHSVDPDGAGARGAVLRWYEIRKPLGNPADAVVANRPVIFQNGTYDPGASGDRWMGSIAMDGSGNMMMGYSLANATAGVKPSIAIAGREAADALNTLQTEIVAVTGAGSQTGGLTRWGDYSTIQVDPADDRTFWFIGQYLSADGSFNWRTRIVSYAFPVTNTFSINDVALAEGNSGSANATFTITRTNNTSASSVGVQSANGTATAGSDYTALPLTTVNFTAGGAFTSTVNVPISGDTVLETNETFTVGLSNPTGGTITDASGLGTINNDDAASIAIGDRTLVEGNAGNTAFQFTVTLTGAVQGGFTVPVSSANGTATSGSDYTAIAGGTVLTFAGTAGETQTATVQVTGDTVLEPNETFTVSLAAPSNAAVTVSDASGTGSITNDDAASIAIGDRTLAEGNAGNTAFQFSVTLTGAVQGGFTVPVSSANGTATSGSDYTAIAGGTVLTFAGTAGETQTATVQVTGDTVLEANETFTVALGTPSNAAVTVSDNSGAGSITNDDTASLAIGDRTLAEGNASNTAFQFTVTLTGAVQGGFTVPVSSANGTATAGSDYTAIAAGTVLTFVGTAGETQTATVQVTGDTVLETNETFTVALGSPSNAAVIVSDGSGTGSITNDDAASIAIGDRTLAEGNAGNTAFQFTVTLTGAVQGGFTVPVSSANGTATSGSDYTAIAGGTVVTFAGTAGETQTATVQVTGDTVLEPNETFTVSLAAPSNAAVTVSDNSGAGSITNDDTASLAIGDRTLAEGNAGNTAFQFTVTLTGAVQGGFTVPVSSANGTATSGSDYTAIAGGTVLTFAGTAGETQTATVQVAGDLSAEADETFSVALGSPSAAGVTTSDNSGLGTIINDDLFADVVVSVSDGRSELPPALPTTYTVTVNNTSALIDVAAVTIAQTVAAELTAVAWTCSGTGGATCPASGSGPVMQTLALPRGGVLTFLVNATVAGPTAAGTLVATTVAATVEAPHGDPNPANNIATDTNTVLAQILLINGFE